jgi:flagellar hook-basal body complex protein FliE
MVNLLNAAASIASTGNGKAAIAQSFPIAGGQQGMAAAPFADLMTDAVGQVNQLEAEAQSAVAGLMTGTGVDVHTAMIATEKANMAFELTLAVHNKAVQAYQSVMGMQF